MEAFVVATRPNLEYAVCNTSYQQRMGRRHGQNIVKGNIPSRLLMVQHRTSITAYLFTHEIIYKASTCTFL